MPDFLDSQGEIWKVCFLLLVVPSAGSRASQVRWMSLRCSPHLNLCISLTSGLLMLHPVEKTAFNSLMLFESIFLPFTNSGNSISVSDLRSLKIIAKNVKLGRWDVSMFCSFQQSPKHVNLGKLARLSHVGATGEVKRVNWSPYLFIWFLKYSLWFWTLGAKDNERNNKKGTVCLP